MNAYALRAYTLPNRVVSGLASRPIKLACLGLEMTARHPDGMPGAQSKRREA
jgi:hypothetical protein